jgi:hypothetical protein
MSTQSLSNTVSGSTLYASATTGSPSASTGAITNSGSFTNYAGIQTTGANTGIGSSVQSATSLAATAAISFAPK